MSKVCFPRRGLCPLGVGVLMIFTVVPTGYSRTEYSTDLLTIGPTPSSRGVLTGSSQNQEAFLAAALLSGNRLVAVGYSQRGRHPQFSVTAFDTAGQQVWKKTFRNGSGQATAVVVDAQDNIYVGGSQFQFRTSRGLVVRLDSRGEVIWQSTPVRRGSIQITALDYDATGIYVTGFVREFEQQGILLVKLDPQTGAVLWQQVIEQRLDLLKVTTGLSLHVSPLSRIAVTGAIGSTDGARAEWFVGVWDTQGTQIWQDIRRGSGGGSSFGLGDYNVAQEGQFDNDGNLYVAGRLYENDQGANAHAIKYAPQGAVLWEFSREKRVPVSLTSSFDEAKDIVVTADQVVLSGTITQDTLRGIHAEGIVLSLSPATGTLRWQQGLDGDSLSGESIEDVTADTEGNIYYVGVASAEAVNNKDMIIEKVDQAGQKVWSVIFTPPAVDVSNIDTLNRVLLGANGKILTVGTVESENCKVDSAALQLAPDSTLEWSSPPGILATLTLPE